MIQILATATAAGVFQRVNVTYPTELKLLVDPFFMQFAAIVKLVKTSNSQNKIFSDILQWGPSTRWNYYSKLEPNEI